MTREYIVEEPRSEQDLGDAIRVKTLATGVLDLVVRDGFQGADNTVHTRNFRMNVNNIALSRFGDLPFLTGDVQETIGDQIFEVGEARLDVKGSESDPEDSRTLTLTVIDHEDEP